MQQYYIPAREIRNPPSILRGFLELVPVSTEWLYGFMCARWVWFSEQGTEVLSGLFYDDLMDVIDLEHTSDDGDQLYALKAEAMVEECSNEIIAHLCQVFAQVFSYISPFMRNRNPEDIRVRLMHCDYYEGAIVVTVEDINDEP